VLCYRLTRVVFICYNTSGWKT